MIIDAEVTDNALEGIVRGRYYLPHSTIVSFIREVVIIVVAAFL